MRGVNNAKEEILCFIRRNKIQIVVALICGLITIKQLNVPFPFEYNAITSIFFEKITNSSPYYEIVELVNNLGMAYYASFIFYLFVDYIPKRKREKIGLHVVRKYLDEIGKNIDALLTDLLFFSGNGSNIKEITGNVDKIFSQMVSIGFEDEPIAFKQKIYEEKYGREDEGFTGKAVPFEEIKFRTNRILSGIRAIQGHSIWSQLEDELIYLVISISENRYLDNVSHLDSDVIKPGFTFHVNAKAEDLFDLMRDNTYIREYSNRRYSCTVNSLSAQEIEEIENDYKKMKEKFPESFEYMENYQKLKENNQH